MCMSLPLFSAGAADLVLQPFFARAGVEGGFLRVLERIVRIGKDREADVIARFEIPLVGLVLLALAQRFRAAIDAVIARLRRDRFHVCSSRCDADAAHSTGGLG